MMKPTRRDFCKLTAAGLAAVTTPPWVSAAMAATPEIRGWVTSPNHRFSAIAPLLWEPVSVAPAAETVSIHPDVKLQKILGFGAAFTEAACFTFSRLSPEARRNLFHDLFHPSQMGLNVCRTCMGASDYSTEAFSYDEGKPDPELRRFSIDHDRKHVLPILREARAVNPDIFLFSSPWSPPGWMKSGGSMLGGSMRRRYLAAYAQYFLKFLQAYAEAGISIQAVTPQNEVDTDQDGRMPACIWPQEYEIEFVGKHLGPLLEQNGLDTKIWILDHNYNLWGRAINELDDPGVKKYSNAVAWHGYVGKAGMASKVHEAHPDAAMHWTEGGPDYTNPDYETDWSKWGAVFTSALRNWCESLTAWNLALDERGRPNIGPFPCGGVVTIHSETRSIKHSGQYWAFAQFARLVKRGAVRVDSTSTLSEISHVAFENPGGENVLVLTNPGPARAIALRVGERKAMVHVEDDSLTTLAWDPS